MLCWGHLSYRSVYCWAKIEERVSNESTDAVPFGIFVDLLLLLLLLLMLLLLLLRLMLCKEEQLLLLL